MCSGPQGVGVEEGEEALRVLGSLGALHVGDNLLDGLQGRVFSAHGSDPRPSTVVEVKECDHMSL
ncbi:hypothetical protein GCM10010286_16640 [Streptomyces toxytricini]|nr:hypothetical protein GCM10010286_16640 [Streptomyces toxytricini]